MVAELLDEEVLVLPEVLGELLGEELPVLPDEDDESPEVLAAGADEESLLDEEPERLSVR